MLAHTAVTLHVLKWKWGHHSAWQSYADCVFCLDRLAMWAFSCTTRTWEWPISTSLKWPNNVKQWQLPPCQGLPIYRQIPPDNGVARYFSKVASFICNHRREEVVVLKWAIERKLQSKRYRHAQTHTLTHARVRTLKPGKNTNPRHSRSLHWRCSRCGQE